MSATALAGPEPIPAPGGPSGALAAVERVQQLQALIAQVEHRPAGAGFASALNTAQAGDAGSAATAGAYAAAIPAAGAHSQLSPAAGAHSQLSPAASAYSSAIPTTGAYSSAIPTTGAYSSAIPTAGVYGASAAAGSSAYAPLIEQAAARYGLDPAVLHGLIQQESGFNPSARSGAGALGLTQLMPSTAASLGVTEPLDPAQSIDGGARYLSGLLRRFAGNTVDALAAYNAGPGTVEQYGGVPPTPKPSSTSPKCSTTPPPTARAG